MTELWRDDQAFLTWLIGLMGGVIFLILMQTYLLPYGLAVIVGLLMIWWWRSKANLSPTVSRWLLVGSSLYAVGLAGNFFITQNFPVTLQEIMKWLSVLLVFLSAVRWPPQKSQQPLLWLSLLILFGVVGILSLLTWVVPSLRILPDMNFLYGTFGHNHFSAVLIFIFPWLVLGDKVWPSHWWKWAVVVWTLWLFSTFSRIGLLVALFQLGIVRVWLKSNLQWQQFLNRWFVVVVMLLGFWFGTQLFEKNQWFCSYESYVTERLCKTQQPEQRPEYWRQAFESLQQHPIFGTGLGTFSSVSLLHRKAPGSYAAHVHNDYLEWLVEAGWWGVAFTIFCWVTWWRCKPQTTQWFERAVWLSTGSLLLLGLFDFDLQFVVFLLLLVVGLGWLIGFKRSQKISSKNPEFFGLKIFITLITLLTISWAGIFLVLNLDWQYGAKNLVMRFGQYYPAHSFLLVELWPNLSAEKRSELLQLWRQDYRVVDHLLDKQGKLFDAPATIALVKQLYVLNPWARQKYDLAALQFQIHDLVGVRQTLAATTEFAAEQQRRFNVTLHAESDSLRWRQATQYRTLAEQELVLDDGLAAVTAIANGAQFEPWILNDPSTRYCEGLKLWVRNHPNDHLDWLAAWNQQLKLLDTFNPEYFGACSTEMSLIALEQLQVQLNYRRCFGEVCSIWEDRALRWSQSAPWVKEYLAGLRAQFPAQEF